MASLAGERKAYIHAESARGKRNGRKRKLRVPLSPLFLIPMRKSPGDLLNFIHYHRYVSLLSELTLRELCFTADVE